jgi:hypothetical protein
MRHVADQQALDPLRIPEAEQERGPAAPVVSNHLDPIKLKGVEQCDLITGERLAVVAAIRGVGPSESTQVGRDQPVMGCKRSITARHM